MALNQVHSSFQIVIHDLVSHSASVALLKDK